MPRSRRGDWDDRPQTRRKALGFSPGCLLLVCGVVAAPFLVCGGCMTLSLVLVPKTSQRPYDPPGPVVSAPLFPKAEPVAVAPAKPAGRVLVSGLATRVEPFRNPAGMDFKMVYVDWENIGDRPVRLVYADILVRDERGGELYSAKHYTIYVVGNDEPGIRPGEKYVEPTGEGHLVPTFSGVKTITSVKIVEVLEQGHD